MKPYILSISLLIVLVAGCSEFAGEQTAENATVGPGSVEPIQAPSTTVEGQAASASPSFPSPTVTQAKTASPTIAPSPTATETEIPTPTDIPRTLFDGDSAFDILLEQMDFGPRWPGSPGHSAVRDYITDSLEQSGWQVEEQRFPYINLEARNIIGRANIGKGPVIILGAHYDTRKIANRTHESVEPVPGAVDGASGVAVLLELADSLNLEEIENEIWLTFFDVEDNGDGGLPGFSWIVGSTYMAAMLTIVPEAMVLVDMIGDADQQLYYETSSDPFLRRELWQIAADLGYGNYFIPEERHNILDDHVPFLNKGIPAVDIIDFDYPYWHTVEDTADKASPDSLERVGRTLAHWLENRAVD